MGTCQLSCHKASFAFNKLLENAHCCLFHNFVRYLRSQAKDLEIWIPDLPFLRCHFGQVTLHFWYSVSSSAKIKIITTALQNCCIRINKVKHVIVAFYKKEWWWWCLSSRPWEPQCPVTTVSPHLCCCFSQPIRTCFQNKWLCLYGQAQHRNTDFSMSEAS